VEERLIKTTIELIEDLDLRIEHDYCRIRRWRILHRFLGIIFSIILIGLPALMAVGLLSTQNTIGKLMLLLVTLIAGLNSAFEPYFHSHQRRTDMNNMRQLHDEFRSEIIHSGEDEQGLLYVFKKFSKLFYDLYAERGKLLVDKRSASKEKSVTVTSTTNGENDDVV